MLPATFLPPHLIVFSTLICLLSSSSNIPPLLSHSHPSSHSPTILALACTVSSSCPTHVTLSVSSVVCHPPSFLRVQRTVVCSSPCSLSVKLLCTPFSSLNSTILRLSALVALAIFRTQLFSRTCSLFCCSSVSAKVSVPYRHARVTQVLMTLPLVFLRSAGPPSLPQLLSTRSLRPVLFDVPLPLSSRLRTRPLLGTRNCPVESVSSPPARCPALPLVAYMQHFRLYVLSRLSFSPYILNKPFHSSSISCSSCLPFATSARSSP